MLSSGAARKPFLLVVLALLVGLGGAEAGVVVLRDGRAIRIHGDYVVRPTLVLFELEDGTRVSLRSSDFDLDGTRRANELLGEASAHCVDERAPAAGSAAEERPPEAAATLDEETPEPRVDERSPAPRITPGGRSPAADSAAEGRPGEVGATLEEETPPPRVDERSPAARVTPAEPSPATRTIPAERRLEGGTPPDSAAGSPLDRLDFEALDQRTHFLALLNTPTRGPDEGLMAPHRLRPPERRSPSGPGEGWGNARRRPAYEPVLGKQATAHEPVQAPSLVAPRPGEIAWGPTPLVVAVPAEDETRLVGVDFEVDGRKVASLDRPPFEVSWEAPSGQGTRSVGAILRWRDGSQERLEARVRAIEVDADVRVKLVPLHVSVSNRDRVPVVELAAQDFILFEDGVRQTITHFVGKPVPVSVALVLDLSFSMQGGKLDFGTDVARGLLARLEPGDRVALFAFDEEVRAVVPFTSDGRKVKDELAALEPGGGTALFDTALRALDGLAAEDSKRVLVLVSDGEDYHSKASLEDVLIRAARLDAIIYAVGVSGGRMRGEMPEHWAKKLLGPAMPEHWTESLHFRGIKFLRRLTAATGGVLYLPRYQGELTYVYRHILEDLKNQFELGYYSTNRRTDGRWRRLSLYAVTDGYDARTREGYYAQGAATADLASR